MDEPIKYILDIDYTDMQTGFLKELSQMHNDASFVDWLYNVINVISVHLTMQNTPGVSESTIRHLANAHYLSCAGRGSVSVPPKK